MFFGKYLIELYIFHVTLKVKKVDGIMEICPIFIKCNPF